MSHPKTAQVGVVGFEIWIESFIDLTGASSVVFKYRKPDGVTTGSFVATVSNKSGPRSNTRYGAKYVTTAASDLDVKGVWEFQIVLTGLSGFTGPGEIAKLTVGEAL